MRLDRIRIPIDKDYIDEKLNRLSVLATTRRVVSRSSARSPALPRSPLPAPPPPLTTVESPHEGKLRSRS